jgi:hypothetical protein
MIQVTHATVSLHGVNSGGNMDSVRASLWVHHFGDVLQIPQWWTERE